MRFAVFVTFFLLLFWHQTWARKHKSHHRKKHHHEHVNVMLSDSGKAAETVRKTSRPPQIQSLKVISRIQSRFATTLVTSKLGNPNNESSEAQFVVTLPEAAFISNFSMQIGGKIIVGDVKEKAEAKEAYDRARSHGQSAGHVAQSPRETNIFKISVNVGAFEKVTFNLTYQEILRRVHGLYKHIVNIQPGQVVNDLKVEVFLTETTEIRVIHVPKFGKKVGEKTNKDLLGLTEAEDVEINSAITPELSHVHVTFQPSRMRQKSGLTGQLVVLYDVKREFDAGEIQVVNGYFVHFFAPSGLTEGKKHVVFVLDKSGSMEGKKMQQTKEAMRVILGDLNEADHFNVIKFSDAVEYWKNESIPATPDQKAAAIEYVNGIHARGGTNINDAIQSALRLLLDSEAPTLAKVLIFLTDGQATVGEQRKDRIIKNAIRTNIEQTISIHSVGFGANADFHLLQKLSLKNNGLARKVYEDSDSALQLQGFYAEISKLMLTNVRVEYLNETVQPETLVQDHSYNYYEGSEFVIVGKVRTADSQTPAALEANIVGRGHAGPERFRIICPLPRPGERDGPRPTPLPVGSIGGFVERMWAYLSIKKLLKEAHFLENNKDKVEELKNRALQLSLKYNFVTELTSMVVVQSESQTADITKTADRADQDPKGGSGHGVGNVMIGRSGSSRRGSHRSHAFGLSQSVPLRSRAYNRKKMVRPPGPISGFLRHNGRCIRPSRCPRQSCTTNQTLATQCFHDCDNRCGETPKWGEDCPTMCMHVSEKCICRQGYVKNATGNCVAIVDCPATHEVPSPCSGNETLNPCGNGCERQCRTAYKPLLCPKSCNGPPACTCNSGLLRHGSQCIALRDCPSVCPEHEHFTECGPNSEECSLVCGKEVSFDEICEDCGDPACLCDEGYIRDAPGGTCISADQCTMRPPADAEADAEALQDSEEAFQDDSMLVEDMCVLQCAEGCKRVFNEDGCGSCFCSVQHQEPCDSHMCPGHCLMALDTHTGCWKCNCTGDDRKLLYFMRYAVRSSLVKNIPTHVCVDFDVTDQEVTLLSTSHGTLQAKLTSTMRNNRIWATFEDFIFHANSSYIGNTTAGGLPSDMDIVEETLDQCSCAEESVTLKELKNHMEPRFQGGIIGDTRDKIENSELLLEDPNVEELPKFGQLIYRPSHGTRKIIATQLMPRTHPIWQTQFHCYSVPYSELNL